MTSSQLCVATVANRKPHPYDAACFGPQGKFNGTGKWELEGNVYEGQFTDGYFHGNGRFTWSTGESFCGEFDTDCPKSGTLQQPQWGAQSSRVVYDGATPLFGSSKPHHLVPFDELIPTSAGLHTAVCDALDACVDR